MLDVFRAEGDPSLLAQQFGFSPPCLAALFSQQSTGFYTTQLSLHMSTVIANASFQSLLAQAKVTSNNWIRRCNRIEFARQPYHNLTMLERKEKWNV